MPPVVHNPRVELERLMRATLADQAAYHDWRYRAVRPSRVPPMWHPGQYVEGDCSKGTQFLCRWGGAPDPMKNGFGDFGNSQTIWLKLHHVATASELEVGDIVTFGIDGGDHAAMVLEPGSDPLLWSFGHQGAPNTYRLSWDHRPRQFCKLPIIDPPPTHDDKLRAMTGFYSWVAWRLGEGPWRHKGVAVAAVRPAVPKLIPPDWWRRYTKFLLRRRRGNKPTTKP